LELLEQAMDLQTPKKNPLELRNEAVACLGDFVGLEPTTWKDFPADIQCMALQPRGVQLALGLDDGTLLIHDVTSRNRIAQLRHGNAVVSLSFSADGNRMASADRGGKIQVWQAKASGTWELQRTISMDMRGAIRAVALTPDGQYLAACSSAEAFVCVWRLTAEASVTKYQGLEGGRLGCLAFSPDGSLLAAGYDCTDQHGIAVWDVATRERKPPVHSEFPVQEIVFSPDGRRLGTAAVEGAAIYDTSTFQSPLPLRWDCWHDVAFSPDSQIVALVGRHGITLWDVLRNGEVAQLQQPEDVERVAFSADGKMLVASAPRRVFIWNLAGAEEKLVLSQRGHNGGITGLAFSPDGQRLASGGKDRMVKVWDLTTGKKIHELIGFREGVETVAFSPDGRRLAAGEWGSGMIRIWDVQTWQELPLPAHEQLGKRIGQVAVSPDGKYFAACGVSEGVGGGVMLWHLGARGPIPERAIRLSSRQAMSLCFSTDSRLLAWVQGAEARSVWLCDLQSLGVRSFPQAQPILRRLSSSAEGPSLEPLSLGLAFRDGKELVLINEKDTLPEVWDITTSKRVYAAEGREFARSSPSYAGRMALSADGAWLAQGDFRVWDLQSRKLLLVLPQGRAGPLRLTWSPKNELLALGLADGELVIWNFPKIKAQLDLIGLGW
jgi:WD40 repeat protein